MEKILKNYLTAFDELNMLTAVSFQKNSDNPDKIKDDFLEYLMLAYEYGISAVSEMLKFSAKVDAQKMHDAIYQKIAGEIFSDRVEKHIQNQDLSGLQMLAESEFHRVFNRAMQDGAENIASKKGRHITKTWVTVGDEKVRDAHRYLDGMRVSLSEEFYTYDGDSAAVPGGFENAENNVNCRCILLYESD